MWKIGEISREKTRTWLRKGSFKKETLQIAAQNNVIKVNYVKTKVDNTQQNSNRNETIDHIKECSRQEQRENKTRHDWVGKEIH